MITSTSNSKIKRLRSLQSRAKNRREAGAFVVEGVRLAEEAQAAGIKAELVLYTEGLSPRGQAVVEAWAAMGAPVEQAAPHVMESASDTRTPQGLLAALPMQSVPLPDAFDFILILDNVRDPGNLGAILRTAAAAGVQAIFLPPGSADPYAPKTLRAGMGAHFHLPLLILDWEAVRSHCETYDLTLLLAAAGEGDPHTQTDLRVPLGFILGGEAEGAGEQARQMANAQVHIPMPGGGESLNAAAAAAVLLFEAARQRSEGET